MKTSIKFMLAVIGLTLAGLSEASANPQGTKCYIHLQAPCHNNLAYGPLKGWFLDGDPGAQLNAARCAQRATEWYNYCGNPLKIQVTYSAFNVTTPRGSESTVLYGVHSINGSYISGPGSAGYFGVLLTK